MINAVVGWNFIDIKGIYAFQTTDVIAVLFGIRPALMMGINATDRTEVMLRGHGVELVEPQYLPTLEGPDAAELCYRIRSWGADVHWVYWYNCAYACVHTKRKQPACENTGRLFDQRTIVEGGGGAEPGGGGAP